MIAILEKDSLFAKACSIRWACWLGTMSYALYVFHYTYHVWFLQSLRPRIAHHLPGPWPDLATAAIALAFTIGLGVISYRFIEKPALGLARRLKYGPDLTAKPLSRQAPVLGLAAKRS